MLFLKACPKCSGALFLEVDMYGRYIKCLQCGFLKDTGANQEITALRPDSRDEGKAA